MIDFSILEGRIGITFADKKLLEQAFIHRSYLNENPAHSKDHNERLEFLGDTVLQFAVTDHLYKKYPEETEGKLSSYRASLVNASILAEAAEEIGMQEFILLSKGEAKDTGKGRMSILANAFESFVGAVYLDQGYAVAEKFIAERLFHKLPAILKKGSWKDAKSLLQEKIQETTSVTPSYQILKQTGPSHDATFTVGVYFGEKLLAEGSGKSKQEAEQEAAKKALGKKGWE